MLKVTGVATGETMLRFNQEEIYRDYKQRQAGRKARMNKQSIKNLNQRNSLKWVSNNDGSMGDRRLDAPPIPNFRNKRKKGKY